MGFFFFFFLFLEFGFVEKRKGRNKAVIGRNLRKRAQEMDRRRVFESSLEQCSNT